MGKKFYTNGIITKKFNPEIDIIPDGFHRGRTFNANPWNKDLTAETDERVKANGQSTRNTRIRKGNYHSWNDGLTKETNDSLKIVSEKVSKAKKGKPAPNKGVPASEEQKRKQSKAMKGKPAHNKGKNKNNYEPCKRTSEKMKGHPDFVKDKEAAKKKEYETKKKNKSFNTSKAEKELTGLLISLFGDEDIKHPYRSEDYPFNCDFYISSLNLYIEYQGTVEHQDHPFNISNDGDIKTLQCLREHAEKGKKNNRYYNIIDWWTIKDPLKLKTFVENHLNFLLIYPNNIIVTNVRTPDELLETLAARFNCKIISSQAL